LEEIKRDPDLNPVPVVILTGSRDEEDALMAREKKADLYIVKPSDAVHFPLLAKSIESLMVEKFRVTEQNG
jgi:CheY-like chemotaxis protein